nr:MAG TPA: hypothetical protein [Caudoviricetes sp.]
MELTKLVKPGELMNGACLQATKKPAEASF